MTGRKERCSRDAVPRDYSSEMGQLLMTSHRLERFRAQAWFAAKAHYEAERTIMTCLPRWPPALSLQTAESWCTQGVLVTLAIGLHNIPEGLAVSTVLVARGISARHALLWTFFTSMPQPLVALPSFLFVDTFRVLLPVALGFAAGCMVWMVFAELLPDALADASHSKVGQLPPCGLWCSVQKHIMIRELGAFWRKNFRILQ